MNIDFELIYPDECFSNKNTVFVCYKGGGMNTNNPPGMPSLGAKGETANTLLYADIERALAGEGLIPQDIRDTAISNKLEALKSGYFEAKGSLASNLNRTVPSGDTKVREYAQGALSRNYYKQARDVPLQYEKSKYDEMQQATDMGSELLMQEKRQAVAGADANNQQIMQNYMNQRQYGTFNSNLMAGLGSAAGWLASSKFSQGMAS
jgi:hypothetical protein